MAEITLVRARWIVTGTGRDDAVLLNAALRIEDGRIAEIGNWGEIRSRHPDAVVHGGPDCAVIPGLVNAHHHAAGASLPQRGLPDDFLEPWILAHAQVRNGTAELDTLLSAARMLRSGVTTVVDVVSGSTHARAYEARIDNVLDAYRRAGMRVALAPGTSTRSHLVHGDAGADERFIAGLPDDLAARIRQYLLPGSDRVTEDEYFAIVESACRRHREDRLIEVWFGPPGPQWVGDECLQRVAARAEALDTGIQTHLCESYYEKLMGPRLWNTSPLRHLHDLGVLGPRFSIAHGVWLDEAEIDLLADSGTGISHNPSSNLRLRAGVAPLNALLAAGATTGIGLDGTTINDDDDMFAEMRLALRLHRGPAIGDPAPLAREVLALATTGGARLMRLQNRIGRLAPGFEADLAILDLDRICAPWVAPEADPVELIVLRARPSDVRTVLVAGRVVVEDGRILGFDETAAMKELAGWLSAQAYPADAAAAAAALMPHLMAHYRAWEAPPREPFIAYNSRR